MKPFQMLQMLQGARNPLGLLQQMSQNNPQLKRVVEVMNGKSPKELEQYVRNTAKTQGVDLNKLAQSLGLNLPH